MTEIVKKQAHLREQLKRTSIVSGSLAERLASRKLSSGAVCLLADISGSMDYACSNGKSRIENLVEAAAQFPSVRKFAFSDNCEEVKELVAQTAGGTDMARAFTHVKSNDFRRIILLTDGEPNSARAALEAAQGLRIDIIFIGDPPRPKFLEDLAAATGGSFDITDPGDQQLLENEIRGLLA